MDTALPSALGHRMSSSELKVSLEEDSERRRGLSRCELFARLRFGGGFLLVENIRMRIWPVPELLVVLVRACWGTFSMAAGEGVAGSGLEVRRTARAVFTWSASSDIWLDRSWRWRKLIELYKSPEVEKRVNRRASLGKFAPLEATLETECQAP